ncbi:hypothetical protein P175DRAFT_0522990 [Aspergillus ochraceoroseus IBT 24754]|uniref:Uncharacterized protein n=1 Tax=Aspergillus ochraceoroseus IBT 24754 TaxID=1392256 RepID=A0A2T5LZR6_9EURO|nr:uncharacterized protein P175DRAFT_0522990 [Aspergillus ochraceoroseus IBT 24754]PTU21775.1 hypothetical protein P175DRAFT_0522990 [Aspergillus ochraceoroseus IBT 24754]
MAHKIIISLAICLLATISFAEKNVGHVDVDLVWDESAMDAFGNPKANEATAFNHKLVYRHTTATVTVTVTETYCGPIQPSVSETSPVTSIPEASLVPGTSVGSVPPTEQAPTSEIPSPPTSTVQPTSFSSSEAPSTSSEHTATLPTTSFVSGHSSAAPTSTVSVAPTSNVGCMRGGTISAALALALTALRLFAA